ncbi:MAG: hypothetical protein R2856_35820 [Caldilineaceae bacterium]
MAVIVENEQRYATYEVDDAEYLIVAFGTVGRGAERRAPGPPLVGIRAGLFRPVTLGPSPPKRCARSVAAPNTSWWWR